MSFVADGERLGIVAAAAANFAHHVNIWQKIHFDAAQTIPLAGFAAAALDVEAEAAGAVAALARFREHGEEISNGRENAGVRGGIRPRRAADGRLIDFDDFVDVLGADNFAVRGGRFGGAIELLGERAVKNVVDECGFARTRYAGDDGEQPKRQRNVHVLQIVSTGAENLYRFAVGAAALFGNCDFRGAAEVLAGEGCRGSLDLRWLALGDEVAASVAGARAEVDNEIGAADGVLIVFDNKDGVAKIAKLFE